MKEVTLDRSTGSVFMFFMPLSGVNSLFWVDRPLVVQIDLKRSACCALPGFSRMGLKVEQAPPEWREKVMGATYCGISAIEYFLARPFTLAVGGAVPTKEPAFFGPYLRCTVPAWDSACSTPSFCYLSTARLATLNDGWKL